jgi:hypothetical protein
MDEPKGTLAAVAAAVPISLRGRGYNLYLVQQQRYWNDAPTYVFDEWVAYTNGSVQRLHSGLDDRTDTVQSMMEFIPYALCVPYTIPCNSQILQFIKCHIEHCLTVLKLSNLDTSRLEHLQNAADAEGLRQFVRGHFGEEWTKQTLGF